MTTETEQDVVCGMTVDIAEALEHDLAIDYEGRQYVFCAPGCKAAFLRAPERYGAVGRSAP